MAKDIETIDKSTGEVTTVGELDIGTQPLAVQMAMAEVNQAVATARTFPRDVAQVKHRIGQLAALDEETAKECVYALPRGNKPILGPSIRFAEIIASQWGNCKTASRVIEVNRFDKVVVAEGAFVDLESGMHRTAEVRRRIVDSRGRIYNDDMIIVTGNAAGSIAIRNAILAGVPKAVWKAAFDYCLEVTSGGVKALSERRSKAVAAFATWGVTPDQVFASLDVEDLDGIGVEHVALLLTMHKAIKDGEQKVEDYFPPSEDKEKANAGAKGTAAKMQEVADTAKPADEKKPEQKKAKPEPEGEPEGEQQAENEAEGEEAGEAAAEPDDDAIEAAFQKGNEAAEKGMSRKAIPSAFRDVPALSEAWLRGFDS